VRGYIRLDTGGIEVDILDQEIIHSLLLHWMIWIVASFSLPLESPKELYGLFRMIGHRIGIVVVIAVLAESGEVQNLELGNP